MENEKDRFGEKMRLVERAKEDIYFAAKDKELIEKLRSVLKKVERSGTENQLLTCPKCLGDLECHSFMEFFLDRCRRCGGVWLDKGELEGILRKATKSRLASLIDRLISRSQATGEQGKGSDWHREKVHHKL